MKLLYVIIILILAWVLYTVANFENKIHDNTIEYLDGKKDTERLKAVTVEPLTQWMGYKFKEPEK